MDDQLRNSVGLRLIIRKLAKKDKTHDAVLASLPFIDERRSRIQSRLQSGDDHSAGRERIRKIGDSKESVPHIGSDAPQD